MRVTVAAIQFPCTDDRAHNLRTAERMVRAAHARGAQVICLQELFETPYFCKDHDTKYFDLALPIIESLCGDSMAKELQVVLPVGVVGQRPSVLTPWQ
jgi:N-carbamoylputrescine amidase